MFRNYDNELTTTLDDIDSKIIFICNKNNLTDPAKKNNI